MDYDYRAIRKLFQLTKPTGLSEELIQKIRDILQEKIPKSLENYYRLCGGCKEMNSAQDYLITPDGRYGISFPPQNFPNPEFFAFYAENQYVCIWGFKKAEALAEDDPKVYESLDDGETWQPTNYTISQNLISHALMHFVFSVEYFCEDLYYISKEQINQLKEQILSMEQGRVYQFSNDQYLQPYDDTVIMIQCDHTVNEEGDLYFSSRDEQHFKATEKLIYNIIGLEYDSDK